MSKIDLSAELEAAVVAVRDAARVCQSVQRNLVSAATLEKKDRSPVTVADFASQALVCSSLAGNSRIAAIVGEEDAGELREAGAESVREKVVEHVRSIRGGQISDDQALDWIDLGGVTPDSSIERYWTLDPIDGTKGFLRGEQYAIALGLIEHGRVVLGVLGCPNLPGPGGQAGCLLTAVRGKGAGARPLAASGREGATAIHVSPIETTSAARFCESVESGHSDQGQSARIAAALDITEEPVRVDSQAKYAIVARGEAQIYLRLPTSREYREKIWDHAAGMIIVEEAGGRVTDARGNELDFGHGRMLENNAGVIATNGRLHDAVLEAVARFVDLD
ncbi:MAG TPA: 3'(2'),5'-bisphosphate nucleotidase [Deltaproteobacteria bacterium]|nr:3'(2'),5'-bisphosphate nucleotidase [Deltaproteobacteria bacterium]